MGIAGINEYSELRREKLTEQDVGYYFVRVCPHEDRKCFDYRFIPYGVDVDKLRLLGRSYTKEFLAKLEEPKEGVSFIQKKVIVFDNDGSLLFLNESIKDIQKIAYKLLGFNNGKLIFNNFALMESLNDGFWVSVQDFAKHLDQNSNVEWLY